MINRQIAHYDKALARTTSDNPISRGMLRWAMTTAVHLGPSSCLISKHKETPPRQRCMDLVMGYVDRVKRVGLDHDTALGEAYAFFLEQARDIVSLTEDLRFREVWRDTFRVFRRAAGLEDVADLA